MPPNCNANGFGDNYLIPARFFVVLATQSSLLVWLVGSISTALRL
ncbi:MAG: hypothetical protein ACJA13_000855, partial [Paraglaciecola sp.]